MMENAMSDEAEGDKYRIFVRPKDPPPQENDRLPPVDIKLTFSQLFGDMVDEYDVADAEVISSLRFNHDGDYLAAGDRGGRISIYKREQGKMYGRKKDNYNHYLDFQSHEAEFDYLKSLEIEEKISQIKWIPRHAPAQFLLSSNDKTVKLWRIGEKSLSSSENLNTEESKKPITSLLLPRVSKSPSQAVASLRKSYSNAHTYHINSVSVNSDQETFLTSDDLRINLWNLEVTDQSFVAVDIKPVNMEDLQEVITTSTFHPSSCNVFAYSTSKGATRLCDMRTSALCDKHSKSFQEPADPTSRGFFSEIVSSIGDAQFSNSGRFIATRDYLNVKIWDVLMESQPLQTIPVHEYLETKLGALYENDSIFDKFTVSWNGSDSKLVTGCYHNLFAVMEPTPKASVFELSKEFLSPKSPILKPRRILKTPSAAVKTRKEDIPVENLDLNKKILFSQWHPTDNILVVAGCNNVCFFQELR